MRFLRGLGVAWAHIWDYFGFSWGDLGTLLATPGLSWGALGTLWGTPGALLGALGHFGGAFGYFRALWNALGRSRTLFLRFSTILYDLLSIFHPKLLRKSPQRFVPLHAADFIISIYISISNKNKRFFR